MTGVVEPRISLAQWSLHRAIESGRVARLDFPRIAREDFGIDAVELVNTLTEGHEPAQVAEMRRRADDVGVRILLTMCDEEGDLADPDANRRARAVESHRKWIDAAAALGCHALRVNSGPERGPLDDEAIERCAESCVKLLELSAGAALRILIENHGGLSAHPDMTMALMERVPDARFGTLPDFGNAIEGVDSYKTVERMMPRALAVSAKCHDFDDVTGDETTIDFPRMVSIVRKAGYDGYFGIEYEGDRLPEMEGIRRAKALLERLLKSAS